VAEKSSEEEVPVDEFELGVARNDVTVVSRPKVRLDLALQTTAVIDR
jgi:hypothetical protein